MITKTKRNIAKLALPLSLALVLGACGGANDKEKATSSATASQTASPSASPSTSPSSSPSSSPSESPSSSPSAASADTASMQGYKLFKDDTNQISIEYPEDWTLSNDIPGVSFAVLAPVAGADDTFQENVNLVVQDLQGQAIDLAQYMTLTKDQLSQVITNYEFVDEETIKAENGLDVAMLDYTGQQGQNDLYWRQAIMINGGKAYVLTYSATEDEFDTYAEQVGNIMGSLTFY